MNTFSNSIIPISFTLQKNIGVDLKNVSVDYVHGTLEDDSIILSVDESKVTEGYEFLQKAVDINYRSTNIISQLALSQDVIFFGHSFGTIDIDYFKPYFLHIFNQDIEEDQKHPSITILLTTKLHAFRYSSTYMTWV